MDRSLKSVRYAGMQNKKESIQQITEHEKIMTRMIDEDMMEQTLSCYG
jgi:hypothetical protein